MDERKRYKSIFRDIENKIQGAMGKGPFEWVIASFHQVFDRLTLMSLYKLMKNEDDTLISQSQEGKAYVFHGTDPQGACSDQIFHTSNAVFKNLIQYIEGDQRFGGFDEGCDLVDIWVRKEQRNLARLSKWGLRVPKPLGLNKNVLVMEYLGVIPLHILLRSISGKSTRSSTIIGALPYLGKS